MTLGLVKSKMQMVLKGKQDTNVFILQDEEHVDAMAGGNLYKYLRVHQSIRTEHKTIKMNIQKQYVTYLRAILRTKLNV